MDSISFSATGTPQGGATARLEATLVSAAAPLPVGNSQAASVTATILSGASLAASVDLGTTRLTAIVIPAAWTTANLTFQTSSDNSTFNDVYDEYGVEKTAVVGGAARRILMTPADWIGVRYLKVRSGTTGSPVNQGADRSLTLIVIP